MTAAAPTFRPREDAALGDLMGLWFINAGLALVTVGFYTFWGRAEWRRRWVGSVSFLGDRFEYSGTGLELLLGALFAVAAYIIPLGLLLTLDRLVVLVEAWVLAGLLTFLLISLYYYVIGTAIYRAARYRLSRLRWRGIAFAVEGKSRDFALGYLWRSWAVLLSLGLYRCWRDLWAAEQIVNRLRLGEARASLKTEPSALFPLAIGAWLLAIPTLGLSLLWYRAAYQRHVAERVRLAGLSFRLSLTGADLLGLTLLGMIAFGPLRVFVLKRRLELYADGLIAIGPLQPEEICKSAVPDDSASGEALSDAYDADAFDV